MIDVPAYLARISYEGPVAPTLPVLQGMHVAHLQNVPFENLDIHLGRPLSLAEEDLFTKVVLRRRGGFCYELNGLFAALLREIGYEVTLLAAQFPLADGRVPLEFDHLVLRVAAPGMAPVLADVAAGRRSLCQPAGHRSLMRRRCNLRREPVSDCCQRRTASGSGGRSRAESGSVSTALPGNRVS